MAFSSGLQHVTQAIEEVQRRADAAKTSGAGSALNYFNWKPGDKKILRFLTDDVITEDFANFVLDKTGQTKNFMIDPADPHRLDRYRSPVPGIGWHRDFKSGVLQEPKLTKMTACVAVLRQEVPGEPGPDGKPKLVLEDYIYDRTVKSKDGSEIVVPSRFFGVVLQNVNFWKTLAVSCFARYGTIVDRDYLIERTGGGLDTAYSVIPLEVDPDLDTTEKVQSFYFYGYTWNNDDPERFLKCPQTTEQWASYYSSEERVKFWLVPDNVASQLRQPAAAPAPTYTPSGNDEFAKATTQNDEAQASAMPPSGTKFDSLKDTLLKSAKSE